MSSRRPLQSRDEEARLVPSSEEWDPMVPEPNLSSNCTVNGPNKEGLPHSAQVGHGPSKPTNALVPQPLRLGMTTKMRTTGGGDKGAEAAEPLLTAMTTTRMIMSMAGGQGGEVVVMDVETVGALTSTR
jgi:hypothetical protein